MPTLGCIGKVDIEMKDVIKQSNPYITVKLKGARAGIARFKAAFLVIQLGCWIGGIELERE